jgi:hypothetical protein
MTTLDRCPFHSVKLKLYKEIFGMAFLTWLHNWYLATPFGLLIPTPLALVTLVLFVWSLGPAISLKVGRPMLWWLRLTWALTLLPSVTGVILALGGPP